MNSRLEFLSRRNKGKQLIPNYIKVLSEITSCQTNTFLDDLLDLESSDHIYEKYSLNIRAINEGFYTGPCVKKTLKSPEQVLIELQNSAIHFPENEKFYLITKLTEYCGLVQISFGVIAACFDKIISYDGDSLGLVSINSSKGLIIDKYDTNNRISYDFIAYF